VSEEINLTAEEIQSAMDSLINNARVTAEGFINWEAARIRGIIVNLKAENNRLREALQALYDEQNGPPLETDKEYWQEAMRMAEEALREQK
jgi:hypothetical protein